MGLGDPREHELCELATEEDQEETYGLPARYLTLDDFRQIPEGEVVHLHYWCFNKGTLIWKHSHVDGDRVVGSFPDTRHRNWSQARYEAILDRDLAEYLRLNHEKFGDEACWGAPGKYLYQHMGYVCRGSGAEPVAGEMPKEPLAR